MGTSIYLSLLPDSTCNVTSCLCRLLSHLLHWDGLNFFKLQIKEKPFPLEFFQRFGHRRGQVTDAETKRMCHRIIIVAGQGLGQQKELEQKEHDTEGGKDTVRIMDEYTRLLLFTESFGDVLLFV